MSKLSKKNLLLISLMLFSMFFGAGNLIFPPLLGQMSGTKLIFSLAGFLLSAVGLPILAVAVVAKADGLQKLASRVNKKFAIVFTLLIYLSIGPFLGIPRAASLSFTMGISPFLDKSVNSSFLPLFVYSLCFFSVAFWLSINPTKLVDRFGKILTPSILLLIATIFIASFFNPIGGFSSALGEYRNTPLLKGFLDGYMTMDAIAALNFGIVIALVLKSKGVSDDKLSYYTIKAGAFAGLFLTIIYLILSYLGACAQTRFGSSENGAQILTNIVSYLFNHNGLIILGLIFMLACLTTCVGLITSCSEYFSKLVPRVSYKSWVTLISISSMLFANFGLSKILKISVPILTAIYPMAIVLIILPFAHRYFKGYNSVYSATMLFTAIFSISDSLNQVGLNMPFLKYLPLSKEGLAWTFPAIVGILVGFIYGEITSKKDLKLKNSSLNVTE
ncbi:branched-chain amino acid:cation transporter, LIVCS family [Clostridium cavendishii DSM 21758]|uniref:Branched-chain amino acid transport system carrier protein n=1 Tax=Clostridium cavendishii DSM 21758 TaxID=1121302 RepID=A0A1M6E8I1_9CLOT|nr:branched-chain amino acid transport system II carrier protein [Clostridium cavendishii]SHI81755.1 branched-chain amino acid:cation transporter, LIVCS family [Clostridium cavendishii DSM 21758]